MDATSSTCHARHSVAIMVHGKTATREIAQSAEEETETNYIYSNLPDDSDDGLEQDNEDGGAPDDPNPNCLGKFRGIRSWMYIEDLL